MGCCAPKRGARVRGRRYRRDDIEALRACKEFRREPAKAAESAAGFWDAGRSTWPAITLIDDGRLFYRSHDVLRLAQERSFEEVAARSWTGEFAAEALFAAGAAGEQGATPLGELPCDAAHPIERCQAALALAAVDDLAAYQYAPAAVACTGARILLLLTQAISGCGPGQSARGSIAGALQAAWAPEQPQAAAPLRRR